MGLMQKEVADRIGVNRGHYTDSETGAVDYYPKEVVDKLAEFYGGPVGDFLDDFNRFIYYGQGKAIREHRKRLELTITQVHAVELLQNLPENLSPERRAVVETACKLVGKVNYFWGGKSLVIGWDSRWGQLTKVWADGSSTTGTYRPYGLDYSGFVSWVFYNATSGEPVLTGSASMQHTHCTPNSWSEAQPGDLVFYAHDSHVGIVAGQDESGHILIIHCRPSGSVVITGQEYFATFGRPDFYRDV